MEAIETKSAVEAKDLSKDPFVRTLSSIDKQIKNNETQDDSQSYLGQAFDFIWREDENSLADLKNLRKSVSKLQKNNNLAALEIMQDDIKEKIDEDKDAIALQENINFYGGTTVKVASIFVGGPVGWAATGALYALDSANPNDSIGTQVVDASLGTAEGLLLKGAFGAVKAVKAPFALKGIGMGVTSRFLDSSLDRQNYLNTTTGSYEVSQGLKNTMKATFNPTALATDAAVFAVGFGLGAGLTKLASPVLSQSRIASQLAGAATWGVSSGSVREAVRQVTTGQSLSVKRIVGHGLLGGALFTLAAIPGTLQAEHQYQKSLKKLDSLDRGQLREFKKVGTVKAEKLDKDISWKSSGGDSMEGKAGDYKVTGADGSTWTVKSDIFESTYAPVSGSPGEFAKQAITRAMRLNKPTTVNTLEGTGSGNPGDYLVEGPKGEKYIVPKEVFESSYVDVSATS